jgi:hypothetical protein
MFRVCSACGATIERKDCHKNRYSEYICRKCHATGIKFTPEGQRRYVMRQAFPVIFLRLAIACMVFLAIAASLLIFDSFSFFGSAPKVLFDRRAGVSLNAPITARLNANQVRTDLPPKREKPRQPQAE